MAWRPAPAFAVLVLLLGTLAACDAPPPFVQLSGLVLDARLQEISGLAASRRFDDTLWMVNDGGSDPEVHAVTRRGSRVASLRLAGVDNTDWEDLAAFELDGRSYLLVADTGDNGGLRKTLQLHVVAEPERLADATVTPAWSIVFRWPDGPRDCEAVAVDAARGEILLVSKKRQPPELFTLPLHPRGSEPLEARRVGALERVPQGDADEVLANADLARLRSQVTAMDIAPDGRTMAVLTYRDVLVYPRRNRDSWARALARKPRVHPLPWLPQAEALAWSADGQALYATGEISPSPLLYLNPRSR